MGVITRRDVVFANHGGVPLLGDLYRPATPGRHPAIVAIHGGGWQAANHHIFNRHMYDHWGPWLAARGYTVFACTYRLSSPGVKAFPEAVHDVRAAVQFVRGNAVELGVDPERIGLMGDSAGGHLAALVGLAGEHPAFRDGNQGDPHGAVSTRVKAVVPVYAMLDLMQQWRHDLVCRPRDAFVERFLGVSAIDDQRPYLEASPTSYITARDNSTAFLVVWGDEDDIVDCRAHSQAFLEALKRAGHFARPVCVRGSPHFWMGDPIDEPGSHTAFLAPRLLRFLEMKL